MSAQERALNVRKKNKERLFSYSSHHYPLALAVGKSLAVYILSPALDGL